MAEAVDKTLTVLGVLEFSIGGNSMGGHVAWVYSLLYPQRVNALVLLNASGYPDPRPPPSSFRIARMPILRDIGRYTVPRFLVENGLKDAVEDKAIITDDMVDMYWQMLRREGSLEANAIRMALGHDDPLSKRMTEIKAPTLILWGKEDTFVPVEFAHKFNKDNVCTF